MTEHKHPLGPEETYCDRSDCSEYIEDKDETGFQVQTPDHISSLTADVFCSSRCAKIAMKRHGEDND